MAKTNSAAARILSAHARHCEELAAALAAARAAGASPAELEELEAQEQAARRHYQELAVDMPGLQHGRGADGYSRGRRPWWRFW